MRLRRPRARPRRRSPARARLLRAAGPEGGDVSRGEVITGTQDRVTGEFGKRISKAVAVIQPGRVPSLAVPTPGAHCTVGQLRVHRDDIDPGVAQKAVNDVLAGGPEAGFDD